MPLIKRNFKLYSNTCFNKRKLSLSATKNLFKKRKKLDSKQKNNYKESNVVSFMHDALSKNKKFKNNKDLINSFNPNEFNKVLTNFSKLAKIEQHEAEIAIQKSDRQGNLLKCKLNKRIIGLDISPNLKKRFKASINTLNPSYLRYCYELFLEDHKKSINQFTNKDVLLFLKEYIHKDYILV